MIVSCEHGGYRIPARWAAHFSGAERVLASHRGFDRGALPLARRLAGRLEARLFAATTSRLLVDLNRSPHHRALFSRYTRGLPEAERRRILELHYWPHRRRVERALARDGEGRGSVLHLAVHSFAPVLRGERRRADLGLLYDPTRAAERALCARLKALLAEAAPGLRVRRNYPYCGRSDGLTSSLRRLHPARRYLGIELEVSQRFSCAGRGPQQRLARALETALARLLREARARRDAW